MPTRADFIPIPNRAEYVFITDDGRVVADLGAAAATLLETETDFLKCMVAVYAFDGTDLRRLRAQPTNADNVALLTDGEALAVNAHLLGFDGLTYDRIRAGATDADNVAVLTAGALMAASHNYLFDAAGVNWDRWLGVGGAGVITTESIDDTSVLTTGTTRGFPAMAAADPTDAAVDANDLGVVRMTLNRLLQTVVSDPTTPLTQRQRVFLLTGAGVGTISDEAAAQWATVGASLLARDAAAAASSQQVRLQVESTAQPNLRTGIYEAGDEARVSTSSGALAENVAAWLQTAAALYVLDAGLGAGSQAIPARGTDQDTGAGTDYALDVALMVQAAGGGTQIGAIDDVAVVAAAGLLPLGLVADPTDGAVDANDVGFARMTTSRVLQAVVSDPTTPATQRQAVVAAADDLDETATRYATTLAAAYGFDGTTLRRVIVTDQDTGGGVDVALDMALMVPAAGGGVQLGLQDDALFTVGTSAVMPIGALLDDVATDAIDEGDIGVPRMTATRDLRTAGASRQLTLLAATTIIATGTVNNAAVLALDPYDLCTIRLNISAKTMDAGTTLNIYVQYSPDGGTIWDDLVSFTQVTDAAVGNGDYVVFLNSTSGTPTIDRAVTDGTLAVNAVRNIDWADRMRIKTVAAGFAGADTITIAVTGFFKKA